MGRVFWSRPIPPAVAGLICGVFGAAGAAAAVALSVDRPLPAVSPAVRPALPPGSYPADPIPVGTPCPPLVADGWLNGQPPPPETPGRRLTVLEIWSGWCPACKNTLPGLTKIYDKYAGRGVAFVGLTDAPRPAAEEYVERYRVAWPCGYAAPLESIAQFGAYRGDYISETYNPGYEAQPTLFILGPDGRVLWNDGSARPRHKTDTASWVRGVDAALTDLLDHPVG